MRQLIAQIRAALPFDAPESQMCETTDCRGCSRKLLEYLDAELQTRESDLDHGITPTFGDLKKLGDTANKVRKALERNGLVW